MTAGLENQLEILASIEKSLVQFGSFPERKHKLKFFQSVIIIQSKWTIKDRDLGELAQAFHRRRVPQLSFIVIQNE
jgi:hypothetical protein